MDVELKCEESCLKSMEEYQRVLEDVFGASDCNDTDDDDSPSSLQSVAYIAISMFLFKYQKDEDSVL